MAASFVFGSFFLPAHVKEALEALPPAVLFLLQACPMETITVGRSSTHSITLVARQGGHVAVWEFSIQALDIGFQVEFEGDAVTEYELVKSTKADPTPTVRGRFKCPHKGKVVLKWDNSFSITASDLLSADLLWRASSSGSHCFSPRPVTQKVREFPKHRRSDNKPI